MGQHSEPICSNTDSLKAYMHDREIVSSLTLDLHPSQHQQNLCKAVLVAPESNGFVVRLHRTKSHNKHMPINTNNRNMDSETKVRNSTKTCPLSIVSIIIIYFVPNPV